VDDLAAPPAGPHVPPRIDPPLRRPRGRVAARTDEHHVGQLHRRFFLDDPALHDLAGRPLVALHHVDAFHDHAPRRGQDPQDLALLAAVLARQHQDRVPTPDVRPRPRHLDASLKTQSTSGASEMMRMNSRSRSSRATGPKMRVPRGSRLSRMTTAAFSSNRMYVPSGRRTPCLLRTITALTTSPFLPMPPGAASWTDPGMTSPSFAQRRRGAPNPLVAIPSLAPVLAAKFTRVCVWITAERPP